MQEDKCFNFFIYLDTDYKQKDKRPTKEIREEMNLSLLGILGYSSKESFNYLNKLEKENYN